MYEPNDEELKRQIILRKSVSPMIGNEQTAGIARGLSNSADLFVGRKPQYPVGGNSKLAEAMALAKYREDIKPKSEGYFTFDENGQAIPVEGMGGRKPAPIGYSAQGQRALSNRADVSASMIPLREAQAKAAETGNKVMEQYLGGDPSNPTKNGPQLPPGTSINAGPMNIPLNPVLNEQQASSVAGVQSLDPIVEKIGKSLDSGIYDSSMGDIGRTFRQLRSNTKMPLLTSNDPSLQSLQSDLNTLKKTIPFTEGGKTLTPFESKQVFALLDTTGKNNNQIKNDLNQAMAILRSKEKIALGGRNAALNPLSSAGSAMGTKSYNTPEEADANEQPGTIVMVQGRKYQV